MKLRSILITIILLLSCCLVYPQLHHQMVSSQGGTVATTSGTVATQSIGQQSVIGNKTVSNNSFIVGQGYQQSFWKVLVESSDTNMSIGIHPNPFEDSVHLTVKGDITGDVSFQVFDLMGRLVRDYTIFQNNINNAIDLSDLNSAAYLCKISIGNKHYFTKLIRQ